MYRRLTRFLLPLVITIVIQEFGGQFLSAGMARMPDATTTLAAFGLAWSLVLFLASPLAQSKQMSLVLVEDQRTFWMALRFVLAAGLCLVAIQLGLALTPLGDWVIEDLHRVDPAVGGSVRTVLLWLGPIPIFRGLTLFLAGLLMRARRTEVVSYATGTSITLGLLAVFALLSAPFTRAHPILLPILVTYVLTLSEFGVMLRGVRRYVVLPARAIGGKHAHPLSYGGIFRFVWPLAFIMVVQEFSRPLINLFIARGPNGTEALAVLTVVYALGQWPYRWLNEIKNLPPAFHDEDPGLVSIRRFTAASGLISLAISLALFWTPLREVILQRLIGVDAAFAAMCRVPLMIYAGYSLVVMVRAYLHGVGMLERRTQVMAPSAPSRIGAILLALLLLPLFGVHGAARGIAALFAGFAVETLVVWWGVRGWALVRSRLQPREVAT
ncbi:MAG: hypothetical protein D6790_08555 [Caldilineae bacterium]|nr:MAG: hypothetical protein D6790_08555 [Caldilineae bacterium]